MLFGYNFDVESIWSNFKAIIWPIIDLYVPKILVPHHKKYNPRHYPKNIRVMINRKAAIWRVMKTTNNPALKQKYTRLASEIKKLITALDIEREEKIIKANNLGSFFKFVNGKLSSNDGIAPLFDESGNLIMSDNGKANILNDYFKSVFTIDDGVLPQFPSRFRHTIDTINDVDINPEIICRIIKNLKSNSAAGPDGLPAVFFQNTSNAISFPLAIMFRSFIDLQCLPSDWSKAVIAPKFKKGQPSIASNYRPIALTCTTCKILEKIIAIELIEFLQKHGLINKSQHGFLKNHSTGTNLLNSLHDWSISLSNHLCTAIAYIDFQRAFDSVSHNKLIHKLRSYGIEGNL